MPSIRLARTGNQELLVEASDEPTGHGSSDHLNLTDFCFFITVTKIDFYVCGSSARQQLFITSVRSLFKPSPSPLFHRIFSLVLQDHVGRSLITPDLQISILAQFHLSTRLATGVSSQFLQNRKTATFVMPGPWNASTERKLLLSIIDPKATPKWPMIAQGMGPQFTAEACRYAFPSSSLLCLLFSFPSHHSKILSLHFHANKYFPFCVQSSPIMPYNWTPERERQMLLLAISSANLRPSGDTWSAVAGLMGGGLTPSAIRFATLSLSCFFLFFPLPLNLPRKARCLATNFLFPKPKILQTAQ